MKMLYTLLVVGIGTVLLVTANSFINQFSLNIHSDSFINRIANYQLFALSISILVACLILILNPESRKFLSIGRLNVIAEKEKWLGINGITSWRINGIQLLFVVSLATGIFMFLAVKYSNSMGNFQWRFISLVILFSLSNSLAEELIFRFAVVGGIFNHYPKINILIISAILFGLPHYYGWPSGFIGVLMAGVLGYILCKATIETKGLSIAWAIHFVQDIIIFTALFMINVKQVIHH
jgi:membrane protease YdiL (CAAX protease family)